MLKLTFYFFTPKWESAVEQAFNQPYFRLAYEGIYAAEEVLFGASDTDNWDDFYSANPNDESFAEAVQTMGITRFPALIIYDAERELALFKLEAKEITRNAVRDACVFAWQLKPGEMATDTYVLPNGKEVSSEALLESSDCPDWVSYLPEAVRGAFCNKFGLAEEKNDGGPPIWVWVLLLFLVIIIISKSS
ncbi:MAG: hypothetical protein AAFY48_08790 [Bacteroidota bacterium]